MSDVFSDTQIIIAMSDDVVVVSGLPGKIMMKFAYAEGATAFVPPDDTRNIVVEHRVVDA